MTLLKAALLMVLALTTLPAQASESDWLAVTPENTLVIDTEQGRLIIEMHPEIAPKAVERVKLLARRGTYDGLLFHRVIPGFVAQTGDPGNVDGGKTELPNLKPEFRFRLKADMPHTVVARPGGLDVGFMGALPYVSVDEKRMGANPDQAVHAWGSYCTSTMGMGRDDTPLDSANAEIFFMLAPTQRLDRDYTPVGQVIIGGDVLQKLAPGEPPAKPDSMIKVQVMADMKAPPQVRVMNTRSAAFKALTDHVRAKKGADFSVCDITVPARVTP